MISQLLTLPCTITLRSASGTEDDYGNEIPTETLVETVCELQQRQRLTDGEPGDQGEFSDTTWLLILPAGTDITTGDTVEANGQVFEMIGDPWHVRSPFDGTAHHVEASLRRTAGSEDLS